MSLRKSLCKHRPILSTSTRMYQLQIPILPYRHGYHPKQSAPGRLHQQQYQDAPCDQLLELLVYHRTKL